MDEWYEKNQIKVNPDHIKVNLPHVRSITDTGCGAASCHALGIYYGVGPNKQHEWRKLLKTTIKWGTSPVDITETLRSLALTVKVRKNRTLEDVFADVDKGNPVMCPLQAYSGPRHYKNTNSGHWMIVIGYDHRYVYFEDSYARWRRSFITHAKMYARWHDVDGYGRKYPRLGMTVSGVAVNPHKLCKAIRVW